ncbi:competence protein CoiA [Niallia sp. 01092]|uniref:competence protein CoiA n=1 Tax=unclassified Niallia TaxID=2837522 RepID=UPI003FD1DD64
MFTALMEDGTSIHLYKIIDQAYLRKLRSNHLFFCPECFEKVILKLGEKRLTHFAHENRTICSGNSEAESQYHLEGKLQLYNWLDRLGLQPMLEPYFPSIKQRGDIGVYYENKYYVIEYQCSQISPELLIKRTNNYRKESFYPIWILGLKNMKNWNRNKVRLSTFSYQFLTKYHNQYVLPTYCPSKRRFQLYHPIIPITINQVFTSCYTQSINSLTFFSLWKMPAPSIPLHLWMEEIRKQKVHHIHYQTKNNDRFLKELYKNNCNPHFLPPYIGVPLRTNIHIETTPLFWQTFIMLDNFLGEKGKKIVSIHKITEQFQNRIDRFEIKIRKLPMISAITWKQAVYDYVKFLVAVNILIEVKPYFYLLKKEMIIETNYEKNRQLEENFYRENAALINKLFISN